MVLESIYQATHHLYPRINPNSVGREGCFEKKKKNKSLID